MNRTETPVRFELKLGPEAVAVDAPERSIQTLIIPSS
jgi:hypothetical protein